MAFASLHIARPADRTVYLNGDYQNPAGNSSTDSFTVSSGGNIAETLTVDGKVDFRKKFRVGPRDTDVTIELDPVDPPESTLNEPPRRTRRRSGRDDNRQASREQSNGPERVIKDDLLPHVDGAARAPGMGFSDIAARIVEIVQAISDAPGTADEQARKIFANLREARITIGIFAPWGAGKTTLIRELRRQFIETNHLVVVVNPWKWDGKGDLHDYVRNQVIVEFSDGGDWLRLAQFHLRGWWRRYRRLIWIGVVLGTVVLAMGPKILPILSKITEQNNAANWTDLLKNLGLSTLAPLIAVVAPTIFDAVVGRVKAAIGSVATEKDLAFGAAGLSLAYQDIAKLLFHENRRPFVFFFDDLDRCSPDRVAMVLESVHSLTAAGCVVFISCDDEYVVAAINSQYEKIAASYTIGPSFGRRFLDKIVQISFRLPLIRTEDVFRLGFAIDPSEDKTAVDKPADSDDRSPRYEIRTAKTSHPRTPADEVQLGLIIGELLKEAVEPLGLNIRQVKSISNTLKLYLGITQTSDEQQARRLAAFVFADKFDPIWLDSLYFGKIRSNTSIGAAGHLDQSLASMIGDDQEQQLSLYRLLGRRPRLPPEEKPSKKK